MSTIRCKRHVDILFCIEMARLWKQSIKKKQHPGYIYCLVIVCKSWDCIFLAGSGSSGSAGGSSNNNQPTSAGFSRMQRAVHVSRGGGRRTGVIVGGRPLVPASVVPEDLISQVCKLNFVWMYHNYLFSYYYHSHYFLYDWHVLLALFSGNTERWKCHLV